MAHDAPAMPPLPTMPPVSPLRRRQTPGSVPGSPEKRRGGYFDDLDQPTQELGINTGSPRKRGETCDWQFVIQAPKTTMGTQETKEKGKGKMTRGQIEEEETGEPPQVDGQHEKTNGSWDEDKEERTRLRASHIGLAR